MVASSSTRRAEEPRIDLKNEHDVLHWARRFRVSRQQLRKAVEAVGDRPSAVERQLEASRADTGDQQHV